MAKTDIAVLLALGAAVFIAIGDVIHQRSAHAVTDEPVSHIELFMRLLRDGKWWRGGGRVRAAACGAWPGFGAVGAGADGHVAAVRAADQCAVHAPAGDPLGMDMGRAARRAVAVIVTVGNPTAGHSLASLETWTAVIAVLGPAMVLCVVGARIWSGTVSAVLLAVVSGALWGVFAVLTKGVVERLDGGLLALLRTPELYVWVSVAIAGTAWQQSSFRAGALTASLPTMTVAVAVMVAATVALARGEAAVATRQPA